jgi:adenine-specific DNA-methyltransferase
LSASTTRARADAPDLPFNRKYLGSKRLLRARIADTICAEAGTGDGSAPASIVDGFCGTGSVTVELAARGARRIVAVDSLESNCVILRGCAAAAGIDASRAAQLLAGVNAAGDLRGYITESFAGTYFTEANCLRMDGARERIAALSAAGEITGAEHDYLLASFLLATDRVANTLGQYDAYMKNLSTASVVGGRHLRDERVQGALRLRALAPVRCPSLSVVRADMLAFAPRAEAQAAYYDPPYNGRQYCDNYHVLENIALWEKPALSGKTRKFDRSGLRSPFSRKADAGAALDRLVRDTPAPRIFLSYGSEGILSTEAIQSILGRLGRVRMWEHLCPVFGNGAGVSTRRSVTELLFLLVKG